MEIQKLYRIRSGSIWYKGRSSWSSSEQESPIFTNRASAEAKMRSELRNYKTMSAKYPNEYALWSVAEIVEYNLVPV